MRCTMCFFQLVVLHLAVCNSRGRADLCYRADAVMARGLIRTIATMLRLSEAATHDAWKLRYVLKRVWGGVVVWTAEAEEDLSFWLQIDFGNLSAPISHDALSSAATAWVLSPVKGVMAGDVKVFAVDTSNSMSGGGEFFRDGGLWKMRGKMAVRLTPEEVKESSTLRELVGVRRMDLAAVPKKVTKVLVPLDTQAGVSSD